MKGKVQDASGAAIPGIVAELQSERGANIESRGNESGVYTFPNVDPGDYTLRLSQSGFVSLTVKSIHISAGEDKLMPPLEMIVGGMCWNQHHLPLPEYYRVLPSARRVGSLAGSVGVEPGPTLRESRALGGAEVSLICTKGIVCGKTRTDREGRFLFAELSPGIFSVRVSYPGFYPLQGPVMKFVRGLKRVGHSMLRAAPMQIAI